MMVLREMCWKTHHVAVSAANVCFMFLAKAMFTHKNSSEEMNNILRSLLVSGQGEQIAGFTGVTALVLRDQFGKNINTI